MRVWIVACFVVMILIVSGCSGEGGAKKAQTPEEIAKVVVQGLIDGDPKMIQSVMREDNGGANLFSQLLIDSDGPRFADKKLEDFTFKSGKKWGKEGFKVMQNEEEVMFLAIQKIGDKYYFTGD